MADLTQWLQERRKAIAAALTAAVTIVNLWLPAYSGDAKKIVATVVLALGVLGVHGIKNAPHRRTRH